MEKRLNLMKELNEQQEKSLDLDLQRKLNILKFFEENIDYLNSLYKKRYQK